MNEFIVSVDYIRNHPHIIHITPRRNIQDNGALNRIHLLLVDEIRRRTTAAGRNPNAVFGFLWASNIIDAGTYSGRRLSFAEITLDIMEELIAQIQISNTLIDLLDIEWNFTIDPFVFLQGGSQIIRPPKWAPMKKNRETWKAHGVNCAAFALNWLMNATRKRYYRNTAAAVNDATLLARRLGWNEFINISDLQTFTRLHPIYKVVVLRPTELKTPVTPHWISTGRNYRFNGKKNILYLIYDAVQQHFAATSSPSEVAVKQNTNLEKWCHKCFMASDKRHIHTCGVPEEIIKQPYLCKTCGELGKHTCPAITCKSCSGQYQRNTFHRCIITKEPRKENQNLFSTDGNGDGKLPALWAYDFESCLNLVPDFRSLITRFPVDAQGYYEEDDDGETVVVYEYFQQKHEVNAVCFTNVYTGESFSYVGEDSLRKFIEFMLAYNQGNNSCWAHNASGYDSRLILSECAKYVLADNTDVITRGGKIIKLCLSGKTNNRWKTSFNDTLLHLRGSLKELGKNYCQDTQLEKGYFPHLFNKKENYGYIGPIPDESFFDLAFSARSEKDILDFRAWHSSFTGLWNFDEQLLLYCKNDVAVLAEVMRQYATVCQDLNKGMNPWKNSTAPSYWHECSILEISANAMDGLEPNDPHFSDKIQKLAKSETWAVLKPNENNFARAALRGGRTEVKKILHTVTPAEAARGCKICYQDICSEYPFHQIIQEFPVGYPDIHVWDDEYLPCTKHQFSSNLTCDCHLQFRNDKFLDTHRMQTQPTADEIIADESWFGIVCATVTPSKLIHPVLVHFDEKKKKCIASCEPISHGVFTSVEFKHALRKGYKIDRIHRFDKYNKKPSFWRDGTMKLFIEKMRNSSKELNDQDFRDLIHGYRSKFGDDFADDIIESKGKWGKRGAQKMTAKIGCNSQWGKNAERPIMTETVIYDHVQDFEKIQTLFDNMAAGKFSFESSIAFGESRIMYKFSKDGDVSPNLHKGYLPAAVFVPAYGRLQLLEQMELLGDRVLYCDTDSIIYKYDPLLYNIPQDSLCGGWEVEDVDKDHGGIRTLVALGPKTYAMECMDGYLPPVKAKGLKLNHATSKIANFESMKDIAEKRLGHGEPGADLMVPQTLFSWNLTNGMTTWKQKKKLGMNEEELKGELDPRGFIIPFGYDDAHEETEGLRHNNLI